MWSLLTNQLGNVSDLHTMPQKAQKDGDKAAQGTQRLAGKESLKTARKSAVRLDRSLPLKVFLVGLALLCVSAAILLGDAKVQKQLAKQFPAASAFLASFPAKSQPVPRASKPTAPVTAAQSEKGEKQELAAEPTKRKESKPKPRPSPQQLAEVEKQRQEIRDHLRKQKHTVSDYKTNIKTNMPDLTSRYKTAALPAKEIASDIGKTEWLTASQKQRKLVDLIHPHTTTELINHPLPYDEYTQKDKKARSPLQKAIHDDDLPGVRLLLENGADPSVQGRNGKTPLHDALSMRSLETAELLLVAGANPDGMAKTGLTPLQLAAYAYDVKWLKLLLRYGADPNFPNKAPTAIVHAMQGKRLANLKALLKGGALVDQRDFHGQTPLLVATAENEPEMAKALLQAGADPTVANKAGLTAEDMARGNGALDLAEELRLAHLVYQP